MSVSIPYKSAYLSDEIDIDVEKVLQKVSIPYKSGHLSDSRKKQTKRGEIMKFQSRINPGIFQTVEKSRLKEVK
jgi:hypothetical protein